MSKQNLYQFVETRVFVRYNTVMTDTVTLDFLNR